MKEAIRRVVFFLCWLGLFPEESVAYTGTLKFRILSWLYEGEGEPEFSFWLPEEETNEVR